MVGVQIMKGQGQSMVITLWHDRQNILLMEESLLYRKDGTANQEADFSTGEQSVQILECGDDFLDWEA